MKYVINADDVSVWLVNVTYSAPGSEPYVSTYGVKAFTEDEAFASSAALFRELVELCSGSSYVYKPISYDIKHLWVYDIKKSVALTPTGEKG